MFRIEKKRFPEKKFFNFSKKVMGFEWYEVQKMGPVPINDMQIPKQPPSLLPSKVAILGFWSKKMRNVLKNMENFFFRFLFF